MSHTGPVVTVPWGGLSNNTLSGTSTVVGGNTTLQIDQSGRVVGFGTAVKEANGAIDIRLKTASNGMVIEVYSPSQVGTVRTPSVVRVVTDLSELGTEITAALVEAKLLEVS